MSTITLVGVGHGFVPSLPVLCDINLSFEPGWTGITGANGAGKSTLLRIMAGDLSSTSGRVVYDRPRPRIHMCSQSLDRDAVVAEFAHSCDRATMRWQALLSLDVSRIEQWEVLSPGERRRWQIAAALAAEPDILLLDEPTNHIDARCRALLLAGLQRFSGTGIVVSHDVALLDELTCRTVSLAEQRARAFAGSYTEARVVLEGERDQHRIRYERATRAVKKSKRRLSRERRRRAGAQAKMSANARMKGPRDSDARSVAAKSRVQKAEATFGRHVRIVRGDVERAEESLGLLAPPSSSLGSLFVDYELPAKARLARVNMDNVSVGSRSLLHDVHVTVDRSSRIHIAGANGSGKTTLMAHVMAALSVPAHRRLHLAQVVPESLDRDLLRELASMSRELRGRVMQIAHILDLDDARLRTSVCLSPGQTRKLALAMALGRDVWAVLLDEPTNDLDPVATERIADALASFPGALLLVSHDEILTRRLCTERWQLADGRVEVGPLAGNRHLP